MIIEQHHFDRGTGVHTASKIRQAEFNQTMGAYVINDVPVTTRWVVGPDGFGATVVTVSVSGRVQYLWYIATPPTR